MEPGSSRSRLPAVLSCLLLVLASAGTGAGAGAGVGVAAADVASPADERVTGVAGDPGVTDSVDRPSPAAAAARPGSAGAGTPASARGGDDPGGAGTGTGSDSGSDPGSGNASDGGDADADGVPATMTDLDGPVPVGGDERDGTGPAGVATAGVAGGETVRMLVVARSAAAVDPAALAAAGAEVTARHRRLVEVRVPAGRVDGLRSLGWVERVGPAPRALPAALSEGVRVVNASAVHDLNVTGENVTIGVLDNGFDRSHANVSDQLVDARTFDTEFDTDADHGTAVAEAVAETAPGADIYLAAFQGAAGYDEAVDWLDREDVDVIVMAYSWAFQPADGTGWASEAAADAVANGSVWVNSAGNYGREHWRGEFANPDRTSTDRFHNFYFGPDGSDETLDLYDPDFTTSSDDRQKLEPGDRIDLLLEWDDWPGRYADDAAWRNRSADFALLLYNSSGLIKRVDRSHGTYGQPLETLTYRVEARDTYSVAITNVSAGAEGADLELYTFETWPEPAYRDASGSLLSPADRAEVVTVGAAYYQTGSLQPFSSQGPTDDGRRGVDLLGPDGTSSDVYPGGFTGTSASAAHVGGVAALVRAANGSLSTAAVSERLAATATDVVANPARPGPDPATGYGRVDARAAVAPDLSVAGRLVDADGAPVADRVVALVAAGRSGADGEGDRDGDGDGDGNGYVDEEGASPPTTTGRTDAAGRFDLDRPGGGAPHDLVVRGDGDAPAPPGDGVPDVYAVTRVVEPGERRLGTLRLPAARPGVVRVVNDTGAPVANATVRIVHEESTGATASILLRTNASGVALRTSPALSAGPGAPTARVDAVGSLAIRATSPTGETATERTTVVGPAAATNDTWNATVVVPSAPRWRVDGLDVPTVVERGDRATVSARVTHVDGTATDEATVGLYVDANGDGRLSPDERTRTRSVTIPTGETRPVTFGLDTNRSAGDYRLGVAVGADVPSSESNATAVRNVTIEPQGVRLDVTNVTTPGEVTTGEVVPVTATVRNVGDRPTDDDVVELRVDVDGNGAVEATPAERVAIANVVLGPGNETTVTLRLNTSGLSERTYRLGVFSGTDNAGGTLTVRQPARYEPTVGPVESVVRGTTMRVPARVRNEGGSVDARAVVSVRLDRNGDGRLEASEAVAETTADLAPGERRWVNATVTTADLAPGEYAVGLVTPHGVARTRAEVRPAPARLVVESLASPDRVPANGSAAFRARVRNVGGVAGNESSVQLRVDRDRDGRLGLNETVDGRTVRLGRGETRTVRLSTSVSGLGDHYYTFEAVTVNDSRRVTVPVGNVTAFETGVPGTGSDRPPANVDTDPRLEDVDGDGDLDFDDVVDLLFATWPAINDDPDGRAALDFDGDGRVGFSDVVALLFEL